MVEDRFVLGQMNEWMRDVSGAYFAASSVEKER